jgi:hypothetical protein
MWPLIRRFGLLALGVVAGWLVVVLALNLTLYSAGGHVRSYLQAMEAGDYPLAASRAGLSDAPAIFPLNTLPLENPRITGTAALDTGDIVVQADYELDGISHQTLFVVTPEEPILFFFARWRFEAPPVARLEFAIIGDHRVEVNGRLLDVGRLGVPPRSTVLVPGVYEASLETEWVTSVPVQATLTQVGNNTPVRLRLEPTARLQDTANDAVESFLDGCTTSGVLQPVSCPFGVTIDDRVIGVPDWRILDYPDVALRLGADRASWAVVASGGVAEVTVQVQSLFDGSFEERKETIPFSLLGVIRGTNTDEPVLNLY